MLHALVFSFRKMTAISGQMYLLIRKHKFYFLAPVFILLVFIALLVYHVGPRVIIAFIYAGV